MAKKTVGEAVHAAETRAKQIKKDAQEELGKEKEKHEMMMMKVVKLAQKSKSNAVMKEKQREAKMQAQMQSSAQKNAKTAAEAKADVTELEQERKRNKEDQRVIALLKKKAKNVELFAMSVKGRLQGNSASPGIERVQSELARDGNDIKQLLTREADREEENSLENQIYGVHPHSEKVTERTDNLSKIKEMSAQAAAQQRRDKAVIRTAKHKEAEIQKQKAAADSDLVKLKQQTKAGHVPTQLQRKIHAVGDLKQQANTQIDELEIKQLVAQKDYKHQSEIRARAAGLLSKGSKAPAKPKLHKKVAPHKARKPVIHQSTKTKRITGASAPVVPTLGPIRAKL